MKHLTQETITSAFNDIYQTIGSDLASARAECGSGDSMSQEELIDVCMDQMYNYQEISPEELKEWEGMDYHDKIDMGKIALPFSEYE